MSDKREATSTEGKPKVSKEKFKNAIGIFRYVLPYMRFFVPGMILLAIGSLLFATIPGICGELLNIAEGKGKYGLTLNSAGVLLMLVLGGQAAISFFRTILFANFSERAMSDVRKDLYDQMITMPIRFYEENRVGDLSSRITADVEQLQGVLTVTLAELVRQIVTLVAGIAILAYLTPQLSLIMLLTIPAVVLLAMFFGRYIRKLSKQRQEILAETNTIVDETLQSFAVVKAFANEWYESLRYGGAVDRIVHVSLRYATARGAFFAFMIFLMFGSILFILWKGAVMVQDGIMESGDLLGFIIYTVMIGGAIASLGSLYTSVVGALGATERVQEILESDTEIDIVKDRSNLPALSIKGKITFENVSFTYPTRPDIEVLTHINLDVAAGETLALVGQSGSGKSTIVNLLMRFYELNGGRIMVDGVDLLDYNLVDLRQHIAIVPQEVILFGGTIEENILYGKPDASREEVQRAAEQANAWQFIAKFPEGLDTVVGERGVKLSGGQRQRVAIARAILRNPAILLLDEATSSLDTESERLVQEALDSLMQGRTSIVIAHRLSTIRNADKICVIEDGQVIESGRHEDLTADPKGAYSQLAQLQYTD
jgi:ABC-type multidrug transport system fused ATPase/permease subunit